MKLKKLDLHGADSDQARKVTHSAAKALLQGRLGYVLITGMKT